MNPVRYLRTFVAHGSKRYAADGSTKLRHPEKPVDEQANEWVRETGNIIVQAEVNRTTVMETGDTERVRRTVVTLTVVYMPAADFLELETYVRRQALQSVGEVIQPVTALREDRAPRPVSDTEARQRDSVPAPAAPGTSSASYPIDDEEDCL